MMEGSKIRGNRSRPGLVEDAAASPRAASDRLDRRSERQSARAGVDLREWPPRWTVAQSRAIALKRTSTSTETATRVATATATTRRTGADGAEAAEGFCVALEIVAPGQAITIGERARTGNCNRHERVVPRSAKASNGTSPDDFFFGAAARAGHR